MGLPALQRWTFTANVFFPGRKKLLRSSISWAMRKVLATRPYRLREASREFTYSTYSCVALSAVQAQDLACGKVDLLVEIRVQAVFFFRELHEWNGMRRTGGEL